MHANKCVLMSLIFIFVTSTFNSPTRHLHPRHFAKNNKNQRAPGAEKGLPPYWVIVSLKSHVKLWPNYFSS